MADGDILPTDNDNPPDGMTNPQLVDMPDGSKVWIDAGRTIPTYVGNVFHNDDIPKSSYGNSSGLPVSPYTAPVPTPASQPGFTHQSWVNNDPTSGGVFDQLTGLNNTDRYQLFPERIARSALSLPTDVMSGKVATPYNAPTSGNISEEDVSSDPLLQRVQDMAAMMGGGGLSMAEKGALGTAGGKLVQPAAQDAVAPTFYSAVENAVNTASMKAAPAQQWLSTIANSKGVKPEELEWTGLKDYLGEQQGPVSKQDVQDYLQANKVQLQEVNKGQVDPELANIQDELDAAPNLTKYSKYQLPGAINYRETLLTLPKKSDVANTNYINYLEQLKGKYGDKPWGQMPLTSQEEATINGYIKDYGEGPSSEPGYKSSHWDEPNIFAHIRMNDRTIDGKKALHLEEIQSDWHQQGREQGYKTTPEQKAELEGIDQKLMNGLEEKDIGNPDMDAVLKTAIEKKVITSQEANKYKDYSKGENSSIPDAPFKKTWLDLALKRVIREAAEKNYDIVSWTPGEAQAARYDLSKQVDELTYYPNTKDLQGFKNGNEVLFQKGVEKEKLPDYIGKEAAKNIIENPTEKTAAKEGGFNHTLKGQDLKVGGEGMHYFYDQMVPKSLEKLTGEKTQQGSISKGSPINTPHGYWTWSEAKKLEWDKLNHPNQPINYINLPQSVKDTALHKGFPLFSSGFMLNPVQSVPGLTPLKHNPFSTGDTSNDQINNKNDVPYLAGASNTPSGLPVNIDRRMPRYDPKLLDKTGKPADLYKYLSVHELEEYKAMLQGVPYAKAHSKIATPAERAAVEADGVNWNEYEHIMDGYLDEIEHENPKNPPPNLYDKPYPHDKRVLLKRNENN